MGGRMSSLDAARLNSKMETALHLMWEVSKEIKDQVYASVDYGTNGERFGFAFVGDYQLRVNGEEGLSINYLPMEGTGEQSVFGVDLAQIDSFFEPPREKEEALG